MSASLFEAVLSNAIGTAFGIFQAILLAALFAVVKTVLDSRQNKRDIDAAHKAIRATNERISALELAKRNED